MIIRSGWLPVFICLTLLSACSRESGEHLQRLAILPPEILIDDASQRWISAALTIVWEEDLSTAQRLVVTVVRDNSVAYQAGTTEVLRTTVENRRGRFRLEGTVTDAATQHNREVFEIEAPVSNGVLAIANASAKRLDEHATEFSTKNERAFETFTRALGLQTSAERLEALNDAINIDPGFGLAYTVLAQVTAQAAPRTFMDLLTRAGQHASSFTPLDRAKFNALAAGAVHAPLSQQETALRTLLQISPNNLEALAELGSLRFLRGDLGQGETLLRKALELSTGNVSLLQQLALGLIETRQFAAAERIFAGMDNNPAVLPALATCVLLEGDARRANDISDRFSQSLQPSARTLYSASWLALSGNTGAAISALSAQQFPDPNLQSAARAELVIWHLMQRDFGTAKQLVNVANGTPGPFEIQTQLLSRSDAPVEQWEGMVQSSPMNPDQKQSVLAYGLFLAGRYDRAAQTWQQVLNRSGGADLRARAMLAGSLDRAGNSQAMRKVLVQPFVPEFGDLYAAISFGEMRRLLNPRKTAAVSAAPRKQERVPSHDPGRVSASFALLNLQVH